LLLGIFLNYSNIITNDRGTKPLPHQGVRKPGLDHDDHRHSHKILVYLLKRLKSEETFKSIRRQWELFCFSKRSISLSSYSPQMSPSNGEIEI
jgi:hypothetical protein